MAGTLLIVHVHAHVKKGAEEAFRIASLANAAASRREPGVVRFDLLEDRDDPARFLLVEVYEDAAAAAAHKDTPHYAAWRDARLRPDGRAAAQRRSTSTSRPTTPAGSPTSLRFEFATATRIVFGPGSLDELGPIATSLGRRALLVTGRTPERAAPARERLAAAGVETALFSVAGEPTVGDVRLGVQRAREEEASIVVAFGGGSALDAGKAIAALVGSGGDPLDYLEVVGRGRPLGKPPLPLVAVPTTAGTGSEVTRNAVLASAEHRVKASLRSPLMLARAAIVDPDLLAGLPPPVVAASGLDAFAQLVEPFVSLRANPLVDALCREGIARSARSLRRAYEGDRGRLCASTWRWPACSGASRWRTRGSAPCTGSPPRRVACSRRRTVRPARRCCPPSCA